MVSWRKTRLSYKQHKLSLGKRLQQRSKKEHLNKHGGSVGAHTGNEYAAKAVKFANFIDRKNNESFVDKKGSTYKFNKKTGEMAIINKTGIVITYFKPKDGYQYYNKQKKERGR